MAEGTGVEPVRALTSTVFKTVSVASYRIDLPLDLRFWIYDLRLLHPLSISPLVSLKH